MSNSFLLNKKDMLKDTHGPVITFFSVISDKKRFINIINVLSNGTGYGYEYAVCTFPEDLDEYDIANGDTFDGVEFSVHFGDTVVISYKEFYYYLEKACENYLKKYNNEDADTINAILKKVRKKYNIS
ncbi:MAG: hypothetical protein GYA50_03365 [Eubacteriaceae bacterium]|nr:hypothetical protein [Eubacteriaceae bacterium]